MAIQKQISQNGLDLIKRFEGFSTKPYICPAGKKTIGYGHVVKDTENFIELSEVQANILLAQDLRWVAKTIANTLSCDLTQNEYDALCSLIYNIGGTNWRSSTCCRLLNEDNYMDAADSIIIWNKITNPKTGKKEISAGLERRREAERALFIKD